MSPISLKPLSLAAQGMILQGRGERMESPKSTQMTRLESWLLARYRIGDGRTENPSQAVARGLLRAALSDSLVCMCFVYARDRASASL